ncbi:MAG: hypothetical protein IPJ65_12845 [Archangiaceae bacterium]|nr:hypothetical protein [Archangiaceae bacterium]
MRVALVLMCALSACECGTDLGQQVFSCSSDAECAEGFACVASVCTQGGAAGGGGASGGGSATAGGAAVGGGAAGGTPGGGGGQAGGSTSSDGGCAATCTGACAECVGSGPETCVARQQGSVGAPSCTPYLCDGTALGCPSTCTAGRDCAAPGLCVSGTCQKSDLPVAVTAPSLRSDGGPGATATADDGAWAASTGGAITLSHRWLRCAPDGGSCVPLTTAGAFTGSNLQTDATRQTATAGDGLSPESSVGTWAATTNLFANGGVESNIGNWGVWANSGNSASFPTLMRDPSEHKFGAAALRVTTNGMENNQQALANLSASGSTQYAVSTWVKGPVNARLCMGVDELDAMNRYLSSFGSASVTCDGTWKRMSFTGTSNSLTDYFHVLVGTCAAMPQAIAFFIDGMQVERGSAPTPYVETNGSAQLRSDSVLSGPTSLLSVAQGWASFRLKPQWSSATSNLPYPTLFIASANPTNKLHLYYQANPGQWAVERDNGTQNIAYKISPTDAGVPQTITGAWTPSAVKLSVGGAPFAGVSSSQVPSGLPATFNLGAFNGEVLWAAFGNGTVDDAQAAALHGFGNVDPQFSQLPSSATVLWTADSVAYLAAVLGATYRLGAGDVGGSAAARGDGDELEREHHGRIGAVRGSALTRVRAAQAAMRRARARKKRCRAME